jgi:hypothetical protein
MVDAVYISRRMQDSAPAVMFVKPWGGRLRLRMVDAACVSRQIQAYCPGRKACVASGWVFEFQNS